LGLWLHDRHACIPDLTKPAGQAHLPEQVAGFHAQGKYVYGPIRAPMTMCGELGGLANWFMDHALHPDEPGRLLNIVTDARLAIIDGFADAGVDGVISWDDMGTHQQPMVSPEMFRAIYFPRYKRTCDGWITTHHCSLPAHRSSHPPSRITHRSNPQHVRSHRGRPLAAWPAAWRGRRRGGGA
jgi:hypothetical protein